MGIGHRDPVDPPHAALHQIHRGQHLPGDARGGAGLAVVAQQVGGGFRGDDPPGGQVGRPPFRIVHGDELPPGPDMSIEHRPPALRQGGTHPGGLLRLEGQHPVDHLLLVAQGRQIRRGGGLRSQGLLHLGEQAGSGGGFRWHQGVMAAVGGGGQTGPGGQQHRWGRCPSRWGDGGSLSQHRCGGHGGFRGQPHQNRCPQHANRAQAKQQRAEGKGHRGPVSGDPRYRLRF